MRGFRGSGQLPLQRRRSSPLEAARDDGVEPREVSPDVQREAVRRHPAANAHADRRELRVNPNPRTRSSLDAKGLDAKRGSRVDGNLFKATHVVASADATRSQVQDGVDDELAGAVKRHVATTIGRDDAHATSVERGRVPEEVRPITARAERVDGRVLEECDRLETAGADGCCPLLLPFKAVLVPKEAKAVHPDRTNRDVESSGHEISLAPTLGAPIRNLV